MLGLLSELLTNRLKLKGYSVDFFVAETQLNLDNQNIFV